MTGVLSDDRMKLDYVSVLRSKTSSSAGFRPRSSNWDSPSRSTMLVSSLSRDTSDQEAGCQRSQLHRSSGQPETHRLQPQVSLRWQARPCQEEERQEGR